MTRNEINFVIYGIFCSLFLTLGIGLPLMLRLPIVPGYYFDYTGITFSFKIVFVITSFLFTFLLTFLMTFICFVFVQKYLKTKMTISLVKNYANKFFRNIFTPSHDILNPESEQAIVLPMVYVPAFFVIVYIYVTAPLYINILNSTLDASDATNIAGYVTKVNFLKEKGYIRIGKHSRETNNYITIPITYYVEERQTFRTYELTGYDLSPVSQKICFKKHMGFFRIEWLSDIKRC